MQPTILIPTCQSYLWAARIAVYLLSQYWEPWPHVVVAGYKSPDFPWPAEIEWYSIAKEEWPQQRWSAGLIKALNHIGEPFVVIWLDDYWAVRAIDTEAVDMLADLMTDTPDILRMDLSDDRMFAGDAVDVGYCRRLDLVETPPESPYQLSLQSALWNRALLLPIIYPEWSPWQFELHGSPSLHKLAGHRVLGTRQRPTRYCNALKGGNVGAIVQAEWLRIPREQRDYIEAQGWLP